MRLHARRLGDTWSERFPDHDTARAAALRFAGEQRVPDKTSLIEYADASGQWVTEGNDRPEVDVEN